MPEESTRWKPAFYADVAPIKMRDPLAEFLGAVENGEELIFTYGDAVKLAGHSCPAVSGAYKITQKALNALYGNTTAVRGEISVRVLGSVDEDACGPVSQIITLITGAAPETGFAGLSGKFARRNKLVFDAGHTEPHAFVFTRDDTACSVKVTYHPDVLPSDPAMPRLFTKCLVGTATTKQAQGFRQMWQERVKAVLFEEVEGLFSVEELN